MNATRLLAYVPAAGERLGELAPITQRYIGGTDGGLAAAIGVRSLAGGVGRGPALDRRRGALAAAGQALEDHG